MKITDDQIKLAQNYVWLSNKHDLNAILLMFDNNATYNSSQTGKYIGKKAIGDMMRQFFVLYNDVTWNVVNYKVIKKDSIEFSFLMHATNSQTGEAINRHGIERITFTTNNLISRIIVSS